MLVHSRFHPLRLSWVVQSNLLSEETHGAELSACIMDVYIIRAEIKGPTERTELARCLYYEDTPVSYL